MTSMDGRKKEHQPFGGQRVLKSLPISEVCHGFPRSGGLFTN